MKFVVKISLTILLSSSAGFSFDNKLYRLIVDSTSNNLFNDFNVLCPFDIFNSLISHFLAKIFLDFPNLFKIIDLTMSCLKFQSSSHICIRFIFLDKHSLVLFK